VTAVNLLSLFLYIGTIHDKILVFSILEFDKGAGVFEKENHQRHSLI
jgi:hypothetical protein